MIRGCLVSKIILFAGAGAGAGANNSEEDKNMGGIMNIVVDAITTIVNRHIHPFVLYVSCFQTVIFERIHLGGCSILCRYSHCNRNPLLLMMLILLSASFS